jgi:transcriptional regulator with PAS, ATPase and Fis domain
MNEPEEPAITPEETALVNNIPRDILFSLLDNPHESYVIVDAGGIIRFMSKSYENMSSFSQKDAVGRHISQVLPHSRVHKVLETGKADVGTPMILDGDHRIVSRIPFTRKGRVIGAVGKILFWHTEQLNELNTLINRLKGRIEQYKEELRQVYDSRYGFDHIIGQTQAIRNAKAMARKAAATDSPILITGESGTGKELFAHAIHRESPRKGRPFVRVNCSSIPGELFESELFGYEPGAFTGADKKGKIGKFELAQFGTIFLDEIGDLPLNLQIKLMRVLQEKEIEKVGGHPQKIDFRIITATNRNLEDLMRKGEFRLDLYYRMNVINIKLPPLRELREDIPTLGLHLLTQLKKEIPKNIHSISTAAMNALMSHDWPGNTRELRNVIERALIVCNRDQIELEDLPPAVQKAGNTVQPASGPSGTLKEILNEAEKHAIVEMLKNSGNNRTDAACRLGIHRTGLYQKMKKHRLI